MREEKLYYVIVDSRQFDTIKAFDTEAAADTWAIENFDACAYHNRLSCIFATAVIPSYHHYLCSKDYRREEAGHVSVTKHSADNTVRIEKVTANQEITRPGTMAFV